MSIEDDFVHVRPAGSTAPQGVEVRVARLGVDRAPRLQFNLPGALWRRLSHERCNIKWSPSRRQFVLYGASQGDYALFSPGKSDRRLVRCPLPPGVNATDDVVDANYDIDVPTKGLVITIGDAFTGEPVKIVFERKKSAERPDAVPPPPAAPSAPTMATAPTAARPAGGASHRDIIERAKAAVPYSIDKPR